ncbi:hypothetical protein EAI30_00165 [Romboutsia ilealis]|uniref:AAA family ATPase n=1 Tax=Romboutsia faecis TaxID=2764597 RepID=A0ABR7JLP1_9FIRM|nr:AAA family ATPase [Romboutsia faecis]MBC5995820.1 AAA family ATPase [Romboutsia faecis]MRN23019.1 hypothetical protein [Romboutsia ilealis]
MRVMSSNCFLGRLYKNYIKKKGYYELYKNVNTIVVTGSDNKIITENFISDFSDNLVKLNKRVLIIDADLRNTKTNKRFRENISNGLIEVLSEGKSIESCIINHKVDVLCSNSICEEPSEIIGTINMKTLINNAKKIYDYIIINTPAISMYSDAWMLSNFVEKTVLIEGEDKQALIEAESRLSMIGADVFRTKFINCVEYTSNAINGGYKASIA